MAPPADVFDPLVGKSVRILWEHDHLEKVNQDLVGTITSKGRSKQGVWRSTALIRLDAPVSLGRAGAAPSLSLIHVRARVLKEGLHDPNVHSSDPIFVQSGVFVEVYECRGESSTGDEVFTKDRFVGLGFVPLPEEARK